ncbi:MAG: type I restriction enzyme HsdR N-terminal domain-containing protein [Elusimicrobiaceae bacterium]|nr:type I restriction enzyme HsdR N-terminal domain-containing protein [Elusimicrobiota bacterium]
MKITITKRVDARICKYLNELKKSLRVIQKQNNNESAVEDLCKKFLIHLFGYDEFSIYNQERTGAQQETDFVIKNDKNQFIWICECKSMKENLYKDKWLSQLKGYCCTTNSNWGILTNGLSWVIYYVFQKGNEQPQHTKVYEIENILEIRNCKQDRNKLYPFCAEAVSKQLREKLLEKQKALSCECLGCALISENVLTMLSKQIKKAEGITIKEEDLAKQIKKLIPQFKDLKISRRFTKKKSYRKTNNST